MPRPPSGNCGQFVRTPYIYAQETHKGRRDHALTETNREDAHWAIGKTCRDWLLLQSTAPFFLSWIFFRVPFRFVSIFFSLSLFFFYARAPRGSAVFLCLLVQPPVRLRSVRCSWGLCSSVFLHLRRLHRVERGSVISFWLFFFLVLISSLLFPFCLFSVGASARIRMIV